MVHVTENPDNDTDLLVELTDEEETLLLSMAEREGLSLEDFILKTIDTAIKEKVEARRATG